jgi:hypothetical protein
MVANTGQPVLFNNHCSGRCQICMADTTMATARSAWQTPWWLPDLSGSLHTVEASSRKLKLFFFFAFLVLSILFFEKHFLV